jgi:hypothetical protein
VLIVQGFIATNIKKCIKIAMKNCNKQYLAALSKNLDCPLMNTNCHASGQRSEYSLTPNAA